MWAVVCIQGQVDVVVGMDVDALRLSRVVVVVAVPRHCGHPVDMVGVLWWSWSCGHVVVVVVVVMSLSVVVVGGPVLWVSWVVVDKEWGVMVLTCTSEW